jgi:hypothetical protein
VHSNSLAGPGTPSFAELYLRATPPSAPAATTASPPAAAPATTSAASKVRADYFLSIHSSNHLQSFYLETLKVPLAWQSRRRCYACRTRDCRCACGNFKPHARPWGSSPSPPSPGRYDAHRTHLKASIFSLGYGSEGRAACERGYICIINIYIYIYYVCVCAGGVLRGEGPGAVSQAHPRRYTCT